MYLITSDIHGSSSGIELIKKAAEHFRTEGIISAGDQCPDGINSAFFSSMIAVRGNCDRFYDYDGLSFPPRTREIEIYGRRVVITHGDAMPDFTLNKGDILISGHTHVPDLHMEDGVYFCNPGSPSRPRSSLGPTAALLSEDGLRLFSLLDFTILRAMTFSRS